MLERRLATVADIQSLICQQCDPKGKEKPHSVFIDSNGIAHFKQCLNCGVVTEFSLTRGNPPL